MDTILFIVFAIVAVVCAFNLVLQKHPISSALSLIGVMGSLAVLYLLLGAEFLAMAQMIVYGGAVMVLFIFVIMLLNLGTPETTKNVLKPQNALAGIAGVILVLAIAAAIVAIPHKPTALPAPMTGAYEVGMTMFSPTWLFPFEAISILLLIAAIGAIVLAKRRVG